MTYATTTDDYQIGDIVSVRAADHPKSGWPLRVIRKERINFTHPCGKEVDFISVHAVPLSNHPENALCMSEAGFIARPDLAAKLDPSWLYCRLELRPSR